MYIYVKPHLLLPAHVIGVCFTGLTPAWVNFGLTLFASTLYASVAVPVTYLLYSQKQRKGALRLAHAQTVHYTPHLLLPAHVVGVKVDPIYICKYNNELICTHIYAYI